VLDAMREEDGFNGATLHEDPQDPLHFLLHETWTPPETPRPDVVRLIH
jgi:quinol monooxygenase YgiN